MPFVIQSAPLYALPNELLLHILNPFPTVDLLPLTIVSYRFHDLILRIIHRRLTLAADLQNHTLLLECYHPSQKLTQPPLFCYSLGTDGLPVDLKGGENRVGRLGELNELFTRFQPRRALAIRKRTRHPAGDVPGSRTHPSSSLSDAPLKTPYEDENGLVKQILSLDAHELFTQLCAQVNLAKAGPKPGIFLSFVEVEDGILRVWREWMGNSARRRDSVAECTTREKTEQELRVLRHTLDESILWIGPDRNVGVKLRVAEKTWTRDLPVLFQSDEEVAVSYEIEYEGAFTRQGRFREL